MEAYYRRNYVQSEKVKVRIAGIPSDLHAANVIYHVDCKARFVTAKATQAAAREASSSSNTEPRDDAFNSVIRHLATNKPNLYNSFDIYQEYVDAGGKTLSRRQLISKIVEQFGGDLIILSSPGLTNILAFKSPGSHYKLTSQS